MKKRMLLAVIVFLCIQSRVFSQESIESFITDIIQQIEVKSSKTTNNTMKAMYNKLIRELPPALNQLPLADVKFYYCIKESLPYYKHLEFIAFIKENPYYRNDIIMHPNGKITIGKIATLFKSSQPELEKFAKAAQRCK